MSPQEWKARFIRIPRAISLWQVPGLTGLHLNPDIMHTKWLGTDQYLLGGVLTILLEHKYDNLQQLCEELSSCSVCNNLYVFMYFVCTIALNSHMHAHIYGSVHDYI